MPTTEELAWAAGLLDADGSVSLHHSPSRARTGSMGRAFRFRLRVSMTDPEAPARVRDILGGHVSHGPATQAGRPTFVWFIDGTAAVAAARSLLPFAVTKRERLRLFVEAADRKAAMPLVSDGAGSGRGGHRLSDDVLPLLTDYMNRIKALNQKGPRPHPVGLQER